MWERKRNALAMRHLFPSIAPPRLQQQSTNRPKQRPAVACIVQLIRRRPSWRRLAAAAVAA